MSLDLCTLALRISEANLKKIIEELVDNAFKFSAAGSKVIIKTIHEEGIFVNCVLTPATDPGRALIRTSLMATHRREHLERALDSFERVGRELGLVS